MTCCLVCGTPSPSTRCPDCQVEQQRRDDAARGSATARGYDAAWQRLSLAARKRQPWCTDCSTWGDAGNPLTCDHLPGSWAKRERGERLTLLDVEVVCNRCNIARGAARGAHARSPGGGTPQAVGGPDPRGRQEAGYSPGLVTHGDST